MVTAVVSPEKTRRFYTISDVAEMFNVQPQTIQQWIKRGRIPKPRQFSERVIRWTVEEIDLWIASRNSAAPME
jgi:excisionase family DNA binding protein